MFVDLSLFTGVDRFKTSVAVFERHPSLFYSIVLQKIIRSGEVKNYEMVPRRRRRNPHVSTDYYAKYQFFAVVCVGNRYRVTGVNIIIARTLFTRARHIFHVINRRVPFLVLRQTSFYCNPKPTLGAASIEILHLYLAARRGQDRETETAPALTGAVTEIPVVAAPERFFRTTGAKGVGYERKKKF